MNNNSDLYKYPQKGYPAKLFSIYAISLLAAVFIFYFGFPYLYSIFDNLQWQDGIKLKELILLDLPLLLVIAPAIFIIRTGFTIKREKVFPSSKMKVLRKTLIIRGEKAVKNGNKLIILGTIAITLIIISVISTRVINKRFIDNPFNFVDWKKVDAIINNNNK